MKVADFRAILPELRAAYKAQRQESGGTFNAWLIQGYRNATGQEDFRTYRDWKRAGFQVRRGESSYPLFSRPLGALKAEKNPDYTPGSDASDRFFKVAHVFHRGQVEPIEGQASAAGPADMVELLRAEL